MKCKNCGKDVPQTAGKRAKLYCSISCRSAHWQKQKRAAKEPGKAGRPKKAPKILLDEFEMTNQVYDRPNLKVTIDEPKVWQEAEVVKSVIKLPMDFNGLKRMAEAGVKDIIKFKAHLAATKLTPGQKSMITSKLK